VSDLIPLRLSTAVARPVGSARPAGFAAGPGRAAAVGAGVAAAAGPGPVGVRRRWPGRAGAV